MVLALASGMAWHGVGRRARTVGNGATVRPVASVVAKKEVAPRIVAEGQWRINLMESNKTAIILSTAAYNRVTTPATASTTGGT